MCRLVDCTIGGYEEIEDAIATAEVDIVARRIRQGVLAFGRDVDIRKAFERFDIKAFDNASSLGPAPRTGIAGRAYQCGGVSTTGFPGGRPRSANCGRLMPPGTAVCPVFGGAFTVRFGRASHQSDPLTYVSRAV